MKTNEIITGIETNGTQKTPMKNLMLEPLVQNNFDTTITTSASA